MEVVLQGNKNTDFIPEGFPMCPAWPSGFELNESHATFHVREFPTITSQKRFFVHYLCVEAFPYLLFSTMC